MASFEHAVLEQAFKKLFDNKHFSISILDEIGDMLGINPRLHPNYKFLHPLHCVNYCDMSPIIKEQLQAKVLACFKNEYFLPASVMARALLIEGNVSTEFHEDNYKFKRLT